MYANVQRGLENIQIIKKRDKLPWFSDSILNFNNQIRVAGHLSISTGNINLVPDKRPHRLMGQLAGTGILGGATNEQF
jgi:hypothetical protein